MRNGSLNGKPVTAVSEAVGHIDPVDVPGGHSSCGSVTGASRFLTGFVTDPVCCGVLGPGGNKRSQFPKRLL